MDVMRPKMEGFGNTQQAFPAARSMEPGRTRMEGFGNTPVAPTKEPGMLSGALQKLSQHIPYSLRQNMSNVFTPVSSSGSSSYRNFIERKPYSSHSGMSSTLESQSEGFLQSTSSWTQPKIEQGVEVEVSEIKSFDDHDEKRHTKEIAFDQERRLVDDITSPGGLKAKPGNQELSTFIKRCSTLNLDKIVALINEKLNDSNNKVQLKALFVLESLWHSNLHNVHKPIVSTCTETLKNLSQSDSSNLKSKATKLLHSLNPAQPFAKENKQEQPLSTQDISSILKQESLGLIDITSTKECSEGAGGLKEVEDFFESLQLQENQSLQPNSAAQNQMATLDAFNLNGPTTSSNRESEVKQNNTLQPDLNIHQQRQLPQQQHPVSFDPFSVDSLVKEPKPTVVSQGNSNLQQISAISQQQQQRNFDLFSLDDAKSVSRETVAHCAVRQSPQPPKQQQQNSDLDPFNLNSSLTESKGTVGHKESKSTSKSQESLIDLDPFGRSTMNVKHEQTFISNRSFVTPGNQNVNPMTSVQQKPMSMNLSGTFRPSVSSQINPQSASSFNFISAAPNIGSARMNADSTIKSNQNVGTQQGAATPSMRRNQDFSLGKNTSSDPFSFVKDAMAASKGK